MLVARFSNKHAGSRIPATWAPNFHRTPDTDPGTAGMLPSTQKLTRTDGDKVVCIRR